MSDASIAVAARDTAVAASSTAANAADGAAESVAAALTHRNAASGFADAALDSAANADASADLAAASETVATTKAAEASTSAANAAASATHADDMAGAAEAVAVSNDTIIAGRVNDPASATSAALSATFAPKWKPSTAYTAGAVVQAPDGSIVKRLTSGTSGASYTSANWQTVATVAGTQAQTELAAVYAPVNGGRPVARIDVTPNLVFDGDSITFGSRGDDLTLAADRRRNYPNQAIAGIDSQVTVTNKGVPGQTIALMLDDATTDIDPLYAAGRLNICFVWGGTNDLNSSVAYNTVYNNIVSYHQGRRAAGFKTVAFTILPRTTAGTPAGFEAARQSLNTLIRNNYTAWADYLCDVGADTTIGDPTDSNDTYYYADGTHPTSEGYRIIAEYARQALKALGVIGAHSHSLLQQAQTSMWLPATAFVAGPTGGSEMVLDATLGAPAWRMGLVDYTTAATNPDVRLTAKLPAGWNTWSADIVWCNGGAGAGDVRWTLFHKPLWASTNIDTSYTSIFKIQAAGTQSVQQAVDMVNAYTVLRNTNGDPPIEYGFRVQRHLASTSDTLGNAAGFLGLNLRKLT